MVPPLQVPLLHGALRIYIPESPRTFHHKYSRCLQTSSHYFFCHSRTRSQCSVFLFVVLVSLTMAPTSYVFSSEYGEEPVSRTYQYRKVMKPMLERKRRARINRCLDELKELMVTALQSEGENVSKLEKADILELTVRHLHTLKRQHRLIITPEQTYADRFRAGFTQCAQEVSHYLTSPVDHVDPVAGAKLLQHLGSCIRQLDTVSKPCDVSEVSASYQQQVQQGYTPPSSPATHVTDNRPVWRPW